VIEFVKGLTITETKLLGGILRFSAIQASEVLKVLSSITWNKQRTFQSVYADWKEYKQLYTENEQRFKSANITNGGALTLACLGAPESIGSSSNLSCSTIVLIRIPALNSVL
jgi:hypothetical protein